MNTLVETTQDIGAPTMMEAYGMPLVTVLAWLKQLPKETPNLALNINMIEQVIDDLEHVEDPDVDPESDDETSDDEDDETCEDDETSDDDDETSDEYDSEDDETCEDDTSSE